MKFSLKQLQEITGGRLLKPNSGNQEITGIETDSRSELGGKLFIALKGERFDGHRFLPQAMEHGAAALCVEEGFGLVDGPDTLPVLAVRDTLEAYQLIARAWRRSFPDLTVVAITGSVGKTSSKEMVRSILSSYTGDENQVLYTVGNTNNQVGVPQNLLRLNDSHRYAVIEMGTNHHGEIAPLSRCAEPDLALVNSIAPCHLEHLGDLNGVAQEKSQIFSGAKKNGQAVLPLGCAGFEILKKKAVDCGLHCHTFGMSSEADVFARYLGGQLDGSRIELHCAAGTTEFHWPLCGSHQAANAAGAAQIGLLLGVPLATIVAGLRQVKLPGMRMKQTVIDGITYLNDAYNANPASMEASLRHLAEFVDRDKIILMLGDMLELGSQEEPEHCRILELARQLFPGVRLISVGSRFGKAMDKPGKNWSAVATAGEAGEILKNLQKSGDLVFLKGSRGIGMEQAIAEEAR